MDSETIGFISATTWAEKIRTKQMGPVVTKLSVGDMLDIAAYAASPQP